MIKYLWIDKLTEKETGKLVTISKEGKPYQLNQHGEDFKHLEYYGPQLWVYDTKEGARNEQWDEIKGPYKLVAILDVKGGGRAPKRMEDYYVAN